MTTMYLLFILVYPNMTDRLMVAVYPTEEGCRADLKAIIGTKAPILGRCEKVGKVEFAK